MASEQLVLRTSIRTAALSRHFGDVAGSSDFRQHPKQRDAPDLTKIFSVMVEKAGAGVVDPRALKGTVYSPKNRTIIVKWIRDVCDAFGLRMTTFCMAVRLTDRYAVDKLASLSVNRCQLVAIGGMWVAAKFEELDDKLPTAQQFVDVCDAAYTKADVIEMEEMMLTHFAWRVPHTTAANFQYLYFHAMVQAQSLAVTAPPIPAGIASDIAPGQGNVIVHTFAAAPVLLTGLPVSRPIADSFPRLAQAANLPSLAVLQLYVLRGNSILFGFRIRPTDTITDLERLSSGMVAHVFVGLSSDPTCVFSESQALTMLRPANERLLRLCDVVLSEVFMAAEAVRHSQQSIALAAFVGASALCFEPSAARSCVEGLLGCFPSQLRMASALPMAMGAVEKLLQPDPSGAPPVGRLDALDTLRALAPPVPAPTAAA